ncbi:carbohydrate binding family 9 domain-containing protein [Rhodocytophaga aerolata]|uniref:Carbohydrate binding family 9 domain-containing protein n=1 Tax=Rhodocytophaga aerolata TaxID=455078 RepID=A0ABT8RGC9_9BACT|nr:carbohydrate binding family 9 domain-containing protein [Rhodocytophaga aerolata]MDO1450761.1 carbohydrate binding family 9 domain-containing protein [Rhodocytophaga aerolata]
MFCITAVKVQVLVFGKLASKAYPTSSLIFSVLIAATHLYIPSAFCQDIFEPDTVKKTIEATPVQGNLKIDGLLEETEWQQATPVANFTQVEPYQGKPVNFDTEVKMVYNHAFLYIAAFCQDSLGKKSLRAPNFQRDFEDVAHDVFGVAIDGFSDQRNAMTFMTNPYGTQRDLLSFDDLLYDTDWDGLWKVRTSRTDSGWVAEIAIPWQTLRYPDSERQTWGINFFRNRRYSNELSGWSPFPRAFSPLRMAYAGQLTNLQPPPPSPNVRIQPYVLASFDEYKGSEVGYGQNFSYKFGGEVKWAVNPNTVLDVTVNTDFAQADVDRQVNNVSRFSVFFPERRQFFLENASLFGAGLSPSDDLVGGAMRIQPFFSRSVGLDASGNPLPIDAGARVVYRSTDRNYGGMLMRQRGSTAQAASTYAVGRYSENIGKQHRLGALVTLKHTESLDTLAGNINAVGAIDGFFRLSQPLSLNLMAIGASDAGEKSKGLAGYMQLNYNSNSLVGWWTQAFVGEQFKPDVGFVSRSNVIATTPGFFLVNRSKWLPAFIRSFEPGIFSEFYHQATTGKFQEMQVSLNPVWFTLQSGGMLGVFINRIYQQLDDTFSPLDTDIAAGRYHFLRYNVLLGSDPSKKISYMINYETGGYYNGTMDYLQVNLRASPIPHISLQVSYENNRLKQVGIQQRSPTIHLLSLESRLAINPRLQLISFYQKNTAGERDVWNMRLAWEFKPLSFVYLVYNQRAFTPISAERQHSQHLIGKVTYLKQF